MKRQPIEWEKIVSNNATDKGLISKIYKQLIQLNKKPTIKKWAGNINMKYKYEIQMVHKHMKKAHHC